jgi:hypothetical protein
VFGREAVLITSDGPDVLTSSATWNTNAGIAIGAANG